MTKKPDPNYVSLKFWMFANFVSIIPLVNIIMLLVWAFTGVNESRKNFFKAQILWFVILSSIWAIIILVGLFPLIANVLRQIWESRIS
jgi:hypothetical protein